ncbi:hypothetical protein BJY01DRAFT_259398 [Aspergillus pseudoustus]|uniref:Fungal-specific transcription factor domain-containing protein n=1 Tax=Aspergillus pseudoustus TaxID=1810923 RepID=A0ABR4J4F2_9EURO
MFVPYEPSKGQTRTSRRTLHAFVAAQAASRRRKVSELDTGINMYSLEPDQSKAQEDQNQDQDRQPGLLQVQRGRPLVQASRMTRPLGAAKFYPMNTLERKGPSTTRALTYYFGVMIPHDSKALGHADTHAQYYVSVLLHWSNTCDAILHGLVAFTLCNLEPHDRTGNARAATLFHRKKLFDLVTDMLSRQEVDDLLIQAICLLIPIDDYLGYVDYSQVHLDGLEVVVRARGGHEMVGQSVAGMSQNLQTSLLVSRSLLLSHIQTSLGHHVPLTGAGAATTTTTTDRLNPSSLLPSLETPLGVELELELLNLPVGFTHLLSTGHLTAASIPILKSFSAWLHTHSATPASQIPVWRYNSPSPHQHPHRHQQHLTAVEKCLFAALLCYADDISGMGLHPAALLFRQPKKRAGMLLQVPQLWADCGLADFVLWLAMVITVPRDPGITPWEVQRKLFRRIFEMRGQDGCAWADIESRLRCFFSDKGRAAVWEATWNALYLYNQLKSGR